MRAIVMAALAVILAPCVDAAARAGQTAGTPYEAQSSPYRQVRFEVPTEAGPGHCRTPVRQVDILVWGYPNSSRQEPPACAGYFARGIQFR
jgi:hypothetical protein